MASFGTHQTAAQRLAAAAAPTPAKKDTKRRSIQERVAESQAKKATITVREPEYDPFAVGAGYVAGYEPEPAPVDTDDVVIRNPNRDDFDAVRDHAQGRIDDMAQDLGFEDAADMHETVADLREQGEAHQRDLEEQELQARRDAEKEAYCRTWINETLKQVNKALADERDEARVLGEYLQRYPEIFYDMRGPPSEQAIRAVISETIQLYGREKVRFRDSDLLRLYASAARWDIVTQRASIMRELVLMLDEGRHPGVDGENDCWARYKAHLASQQQTKKGGGKKVAFAVLGAYLLGVF